MKTEWVYSPIADRELISQGVSGMLCSWLAQRDMTVAEMQLKAVSFGFNLTLERVQAYLNALVEAGWIQCTKTKVPDYVVEGAQVLCSAHQSYEGGDMITKWAYSPANCKLFKDSINGMLCRWLLSEDLTAEQILDRLNGYGYRYTLAGVQRRMNALVKVGWLRCTCTKVNEYDVQPTK